MLFVFTFHPKSLLKYIIVSFFCEMLLLLIKFLHAPKTTTRTLFKLFKKCGFFFKNVIIVVPFKRQTSFHVSFLCCSACLFVLNCNKKNTFLMKTFCMIKKIFLFYSLFLGSFDDLFKFFDELLEI